MDIEISASTDEADEFSKFLTDNGYQVKIGMTSASYVDGISTDTSEYANKIMNSLWEEYCNS